MSKRLKLFISEIKTSFVVLKRAIWHEYYPAIFIGIFFLILFILQWLFEYQQFYEVMIVNDAMLSVGERVSFLGDALLSFFQYWDDLTPISLILIAFFQASIVVIWLRAKNVTSLNKASASALGIGLLGSGCVACASSFSSVIFSLVGSAVSVALVNAIGDILLMLAVILSIKTFIDLAVSVSGHLNE